MTRIIGYAYEAALHCPECTGIRFQKESSFAEADGHNIPYNLTDNEGNPVHPVFSTDEQETPPYCHDCFEPLT